MSVARVVWLVAALAAGCGGVPGTFECTADAQCAVPGSEGRCEASGYCSVEDPGCASGRRFRPHAGEGLGGRCVATEDPPEPDAGRGADAGGDPDATPMPGAPETIWPDALVPGDSGPEGEHFELGTIFYASVPGKVTHLRVYALGSEAGVHVARIWRDGDVEPVAGPFGWDYEGAEGWIKFDILDVPIDAHVAYTVAVSTGDEGGQNYPDLPAALAEGGDNGAHLVYPAEAGVFTRSVGARPDEAYDASNYLRDVVFVP